MLYQCSGSMDPRIVRQAFKQLLPIWQHSDLAECLRLEDAIIVAAEPGTVQPLAQRIQGAWPVKAVQSGAADYSLPLGRLSAQNLVTFLRAAEQLVLEVKLAPLVVYWSSKTAATIVPDGTIFRKLLRDALCVSIFFNQEEDAPEEVCFWMEACGLCLVVYGQQTKGGNDSIQGIYLNPSSKLTK